MPEPRQIRAATGAASATFARLRQLQRLNAIAISVIAAVAAVLVLTSLLSLNDRATTLTDRLQPEQQLSQVRERMRTLQVEIWRGRAEGRRDLPPGTIATIAQAVTETRDLARQLGGNPEIAEIAARLERDLADGIDLTRRYFTATTDAERERYVVEGTAISERISAVGDEFQRRYTALVLSAAERQQRSITVLIIRLLILLGTAFAIAIALQILLARARRRALREAEAEATTDSLTGLLNRRAFDTALHRAWSEAGPSETTTIVVIDADNFKQINDRFGHPAGDEVLHAVARELAAVARTDDVIGRVGGEEFAMLLTAVDHDDARAIVERTRGLVAASEVPARFGLTMSAGLCSFADATGPNDAFAKADAALLAAKAAGRNRVLSHRHDTPPPTPMAVPADTR